MSRTDVERPLQVEALREIERSLYGKLQAHRLADSFVERVGEDAVQKGWIEYLRAVGEGVEVENRDAFIVQAAFRRAVDELRREARQSDGAALEAILESGRLAASASDELAIEHLAAEELHQAIETLPAEERQALSLHYFEQLSDRRSAEILYCSERTFRRRVEKALRMLGYRLGVPAPEPGSELAIEVGLAAWVSLGGARVAFACGPLELLAALVDTARELAALAAGRIRDLGSRAFASGAPERAAEIASGPAGRAGGACAGVLALCLASGMIGPGVGGVDLIGAHGQPPKPTRHHSRPEAPLASAGGTEAPARTQGSTEGPGSASPSAPGAASTAGVTMNKQKREARQVKEQTDGIARAAGESSAPVPPTPAVTSSGAGEPTATAAPGGGSSATSASAEETQAEQQFGAFK